MDYVKLFKTIEDDDFYIIKRSINNKVLDEWEKTTKILQSTEKDYPEEIGYLNTLYKNKINNYINEIIRKYKCYYNHELNSIKNEYYKIKESLTNELHILYRLENHIDIKNREEIMDILMITISNNLWHKEDKNIFFVKFVENKTELACDIDNFYETNKIGNINLLDEYNKNNENIISRVNRVQIKFANQVSNKVCKCIIISWEDFVKYRDSFRIPKINNNKYVITYDRYEDPPIKITFDNRTELSKEEIDNFKIMTNNLTVFDNDSILIDKMSFITNFVNKDLIVDKIRSLINNKDYTFNHSSQYEINDSECIDDIDNNDNIDNQLHSLRLSKL
jgi:hypothetical protein